MYFIFGIQRNIHARVIHITVYNNNRNISENQRFIYNSKCRWKSNPWRNKRYICVDEDDILIKTWKIPLKISLKNIIKNEIIK